MATYSDKLERIIHSLSQNTGLMNLIPGSKAYQLAESVAYEQMQLEFKIEANNKKNSLLTAESSELDDIGESFFGTYRLGQIAPFISESMKSLKFYVDTGSFGDINYSSDTGVRIGQDIIIPEGAIVEGRSDGRLLRFRIKDQVILDSNLNEKYVSAELIQGTYEHILPYTLASHNFVDYTQSANRSLLVTNQTVIGTGRTEETDENFRYRLTNSLRAFPKTTTAGIHEIATSLADVSDVIIDQSANGGGTFNVYVQGTTPVTSDQTIESVKSVLQECIGPWVSYNILKPRYIGLSVAIRVSLIDAAATMPTLQTIRDSITNYINNQYGGTFAVNNMIRIAELSHDNIASATFDYVRVYHGTEGSRAYTELDFVNNPSPVLYLANTEKLIVETLSGLKNPINVMV